jgi:glucose-1-phosphate thymidylyltransferase
MEKDQKHFRKTQKPTFKIRRNRLYIYDNTVFDRIRTLKPSKRGELEVTDLNNSYLKDGKLDWCELQGYWRDAGHLRPLWKRECIGITKKR